MADGRGMSIAGVRLTSAKSGLAGTFYRVFPL